MSMNDYFKSRPITDHLDYAVTELAKAAELVKTSATRAIQALGNDFGEVQSFEQYPLTDALRRRDSYEFSGKAALDSAYKESLPVIERNKKVAEHNRVLRDRVTALLTAIKLPSSRVCISNRGGGKYTDAGWQKSVAAIPTNCGWSELERSYRDRLQSIEEKKRKEEYERAQELRKREEAEKAVQARVVAKLVAKDLGIAEDDRYSVWEALLSRNKYLRLADAGLRTRGDWSDGPWRVKDAMDHFTIENAQDNAIAEAYRGELSDWCGDGRIFRDFEWNYDKLFAMAKEQDPALFSLYEKMKDSETRDEW